MCTAYDPSEPNVTLRFINVDKQNNANDCGLYALAFCAALCSGDNPQHITFFNTDMRKHVLHCLMQNEMEPFNGKMLKRKKMVKETQLLEIICTCRSIEDGKHGGMRRLQEMVPSRVYNCTRKCLEHAFTTMDV